MPIFDAPDGTRLAYHLVGEGEPLLCLPGGATRASAYLGELGGLGAHRQLVLLDLRGTGESAVPDDEDSYRCGRQVPDVEALRAHLGLERIDVLAHSAGANLALLYAAAHPERVRSLALITPTAWEAGIPVEAGEPLAATRPPRDTPWFEEADAACKAALAALDAPVLVLAGASDGLPAPARAAEIAALFPHGEVAVQRGGGHFPWLDDPGGFVRTVAAFLDPEVHGVRLPGGNRIAYRVWGDPAAPPVVLLHGRTVDSTNWRRVAKAIATTRRVYAPDLRGHGLSDWPGDYAYPRLVADVREFLDALGLERVDLVGHSMGGAVALQVAEAEPDRVGRMVLEDALPPFPLDPPRATEPRPAPEELRGLRFDWDLIPTLDRDANHPDPAWEKQLGVITAPVLVLSGGALSFLPEKDQRRLAELIPGARTVTLPVGHLIHASDPDGFLAELKGFGMY